MPISLSSIAIQFKNLTNMNLPMGAIHISFIFFCFILKSDLVIFCRHLSMLPRVCAEKIFSSCFPSLRVGQEKNRAGRRGLWQDSMNGVHRGGGILAWSSLSSYVLCTSTTGFPTRTSDNQSTINIDLRWKWFYNSPLNSCRLAVYGNVPRQHLSVAISMTILSRAVFVYSNPWPLQPIVSESYRLRLLGSLDVRSF